MEVVIIGFFILLILGPLLFVFRIANAFSDLEVRKKIQNQKLFHAVWFVGSVLCVLLFLGILVPNRPGSLGAARRVQTSNLEEQIRTAILSYETEYGATPSVRDNKNLVKVLMGGEGTAPPDNPRAIAFLTLRPKDMNAQGEAIDAWGTPFRIITTNPQNPLVQSAGPDQVWGTQDDISCVTH